MLCARTNYVMWNFVIGEFKNEWKTLYSTTHCDERFSRSVVFRDFHQRIRLCNEYIFALSFLDD